MIALDPRLTCIYNAAGECDCVADIGSDHAKLPIAMLQTGKAKKAIACDINGGPLKNSMSTATRYAISNIDFVLSDGFDALDSFNFDQALICGMGGSLIADIIKRGESKAHCRLVLQPMTAFEELRGFLWSNGFVIDDEFYAADKTKPYLVINAHYTGNNTPFSFTDLYLGKRRSNTPEYNLFCKKILARSQKMLSGVLHNEEDGSHLISLIEECGCILK